MKALLATTGWSRAQAVICLHASGSSGAQWRTLARMLQHEFDVLTPDLYGHGSAPAWHGTPADVLAADASRVARLVASAEQVHLVGHSYGGAVALQVALRHPARIASVSVYEPVPMRILFDYGARHRAATEVADVAGTIRRELNGGSTERAAQRFVDYWWGAPQWATLDAMQRAAITACMPVIRDHFAALTHAATRLGDYRRVDAPVLYLKGRTTRASARRMAKLLQSVLPRVESVTFAAPGHLGPMTHAALVAEPIAQFVRWHAAARVQRLRNAA